MGRAARFLKASIGQANFGLPVIDWLFCLRLGFRICRPNQTAQALAQTAQAPPYAQQTPEQLQQLVAPIALYPDSLVAQILAASTFPEQVVQADRWVQAHPDLKGEALGQAVDQQPWDPSVKALTAFPSVLGNMDKNLSWTSSLGDAYYNQQQDVMDAVQVMRQRARASRHSEDHAAANRNHARFDGHRFSLLTPMLFTFPRMIRGWFTDIPYSRGRGGTHIPESGMTAHTSHLESASGLASSGVSDGAGPTGDSIGITDTQFITTTGTTPEAPRFTTGTITTEEEASAADLQLAPTQATGLRAATSAEAAEFTTVPADTTRPFNGTCQLLADTLNPAVRAEPARGPSTATDRADRQEAIRRAEAPA